MATGPALLSHPRKVGTTNIRLGASINPHKFEEGTIMIPVSYKETKTWRDYEIFSGSQQLGLKTSDSERQDF